MPIKYLSRAGGREGGRQRCLDGSPGRPSSMLDGAEQRTCAELADSDPLRSLARCARGEETRTVSRPGCWRPTSPLAVSKDNIQAPGQEKSLTERQTGDTNLTRSAKGGRLLSIAFAHDHPLKAPLDQRRQQAMHPDDKTTVTRIHGDVFSFVLLLCVNINLSFRARF